MCKSLSCRLADHSIADPSAWAPNSQCGKNGSSAGKGPCAVPVATETSFLDREAGHHLLGQLRIYYLCRIILWRVREISKHPIQQLDMVNVVTRQAAHVTSVVLSTLPAKVGAIHRVALQAGFIGLRSCPLAWITYVPAASGLSTRFSVLFAVRVADLALSSARIV